MSTSASPSSSRIGPEALRELVARRAHEIWQSEGCPPGRALDHWLVAEREIVLPLEEGTTKSRSRKTTTRRKTTSKSTPKTTSKTTTRGRGKTTSRSKSRGR